MKTTLQKTVFMVTILFYSFFNSTNLLAQYWLKTARPGGEKIRCNVVYGSTIFSGNSEGIFISNDNGQTWSAANNGLTCIDINSMLISESNIIASSEHGKKSVFSSSDNGKNWKMSNTGLPENYNVRLLANGGKKIYAVVTGYIEIPGGNTFVGKVTGNQEVDDVSLMDIKVFSSSDNGKNWKETGEKKPDIISNNILQDEIIRLRNKNNLELALRKIYFNTGPVQCKYKWHKFTWVGAAEGIFLTTNGGKSWKKCDLFPECKDFVSMKLIDSFLKATNRDGKEYVMQREDFTTWLGRGGIAVPGVKYIQTETGIDTVQSRTLKSVEYSFVGTPNGIYMKQKKNFYWINISYGLSNLDITELSYETDGIKATTRNGQEFWMDVDQDFWFWYSKDEFIEHINAKKLKKELEIKKNTWRLPDVYTPDTRPDTRLVYPNGNFGSNDPYRRKN